MKKCLLIPVLVIALFGTTKAQRFFEYDIGFLCPHNPVPMHEPPSIPQKSFYQYLKVENRIKTTQTFNLKGKVKSVNEAIFFKKGTSFYSINSSYKFLANQRLKIYEEDSLNPFCYGKPGLEKFKYDSSGEQLVSILRRSNFGLQYEFFYDSDGYLMEKRLRKYDEGKDTKYKNTYDYNSTYNWNVKRDSVAVKFNYKTERIHYEREKDRRYSFVKEIKRLEEPERLKDKARNRLDLFWEQEKKEYDDFGNLLRYHIFDNPNKSSYPINQLYEFTYNERNELIEIKFHMSGPNGSELVLQSTTRIQYLIYDNHGNWTTKKVSTDGFRSKNENEQVYLFKRDIKYY